MSQAFLPKNKPPSIGRKGQLTVCCSWIFSSARRLLLNVGEVNLCSWAIALWVVRSAQSPLPLN